MKIAVAISFTHQLVFGRSLYYPACSISAAICNLMGVGSLSENKLQILKKSGLPVTITEAWCAE